MGKSRIVSDFKFAEESMFINITKHIMNVFPSQFCIINERNIVSAKLTNHEEKLSNRNS